MANQRVGGSLPLSEVRRLELSANRAKLLVEKSQSEQRIAGLTLRARDVAVAIAQQNAARCQIVSSIDGEVIELQKQLGEWVNPGEPIAHIVRLDRLRVEGFVSAAEHSPSELADQPVVATVQLARGETAEFAGRIVFVRPVVQGGGQFLVYAEVANRSQGGHWLLQPGMVAQMTIGASRSVESKGRISAASMIPRPVRDAK
jgi:multidrug efflux pump subunit AcrA (membrane-fusion protein)